MQEFHSSNNRTGKGTRRNRIGLNIIMSQALPQRDERSELQPPFIPA
jgi:hypothetical protein